VSKDKIILMAHFDPAGTLTPDWRGLIRRLQDADFADLVLISTGLNHSAYREELGDLRVLVRDNIGYDFYSWRHAILDSTLSDYREAILFNSSFYVTDAVKFCAVLKEPMPADAAFRGLTVSWERDFHAQSYFLQFSNEVIRSQAFGRFWQGMQPISDRSRVIEVHELGLSRALSRQFRIDSILPLGAYEKFLLLRRGLKDSSWITGANLEQGYERARNLLNPSLMLWECLLHRYGIVKKQLVRENPLNWPIDDLKRFVAACILE
jgi:hypothetical protein